MFLGYDYVDRGLFIFDCSDYLDYFDVLCEFCLRMLQGIIIMYLFEDYQGGLWIGMLKDGIYYFFKLDLVLGFFDDLCFSILCLIVMVFGDIIWIRI